MAATSADSEVKDSINLFKEHHNRMKELVSWPLTDAAKVSDVDELEPSLQAIYEAMWEMKTHEYIENHYIMDQLKQRLQSRRVYNEVVCNCHEDSKLLDVIALVERVYQADTQRERVKYGRRLQKAIKDFLDEFLPHMDEEESIFQPLLVENFDSSELKDMKEIVQKQHSLFRERVKSEKSLKALKRKRSVLLADKSKELDFSLEDLRFKKSYCQEVNDFLKKNPKSNVSAKASGEKESKDSNQNVQDDDDSSDEVAAKKSKLAIDHQISDIPTSSKDSDQGPSHLKTSNEYTIEDFPEELLVLIFSHLNPKSLLACGAVNHRWRKVAFSSVFWRALYPTQWARGQWSFDYIPLDLRADDDLLMSLSASSSIASSLSSSCESLSGAETEDDPAPWKKGNATSQSEEDRVYFGLGLHLLPRIGWSVSTMILSASKTLNDQHVQILLSQVPNVRTVNLAYTHITSEAFNGLGQRKALRKLEELVLSGCVRVGDGLFAHLAKCYETRRPSKLRRLILSGCRSLTSLTLEYLAIHSLNLQELDASGCYKMDGESLTLFVEECGRLRPEKLAYCNDIEDGPYPDTASGCLNLECELRFCCQRLKN